MSLVPIGILLVIGGLVAVTALLAIRYWRSIRRVATELGWARALAVAVGNIALVVGVFVLTAGTGAAGLRASGWIGALLGLPDPLRAGLAVGVTVSAITGVTVLIALAYDRLFPRVVQAFS